MKKIKTSVIIISAVILLLGLSSFFFWKWQSRQNSFVIGENGSAQKETLVKECTCGCNMELDPCDCATAKMLKEGLSPEEAEAREKELKSMFPLAPEEKEIKEDHLETDASSHLH